jgi:signal transduction histidine kinase
MVVLASTAPTQDLLARGYVFPPGVGLPARTIAEGRPVWSSDVLSRDDILMPDDLRRRLADSGTTAVLAVPLCAKGKTIGALVIRGRTGRVFSKDEVALLEAFAAQAALALENARLFEETRRLVGELGATTKELGAKNKELDTFVYTVSHDLKAPLVTLQGMADLLGESCERDLDEQGRHYVTRIKANAQQMERLVQDLLALSRIGREGREPEAVGLDDVVDELLMEGGERIRARGVTVTRHELPTLWGVRTQIEQVVSNLLGNAIKYLGDTPAPVVEIGAKDGGGEMVECYVKDNGIGIDPAYHEKVFEIFQRLQETEAEGTGVGLAIVKKIIEGAGGRIWVESAKGQGAAFRFTWPRAEVAA